MNPESTQWRGLRLFLSVDIAGSTALKNQYNHAVLREKYLERRQELLSLSKKNYIDLKFKLFDDDGQDCSSGINSILHDHSVEDSDWAAIISGRFRDFHTQFTSELEKINESFIIDDDLCIWKALGDELIYALKVRNPQELHDLVLAFLSAIRFFDRQDVGRSGKKRKKQIRVKGCGWVAGFPIRNREITILKRPVDYLGPDVDTGFRISKHSYPGFMVMSAELAELLGTAEKKYQLRGMIVGWQRLKGVWDDEPYPIIWATLPNDHPQTKDGTYEPFSPSAHSENSFVAAWQKANHDIHELKFLTDELSKIRGKLPSSLGLVQPYFGSETDDGNIPEEHKTIHRILNSLSEGITGSQNAEEGFDVSEPVRTPDEVSDSIKEELDSNIPGQYQPTPEET